MPIKIHFSFCAVVWQHATPGGWHFVSLPLKLTTEIREYAKELEEGWGRLKVTAKIGETTWDTAIWYDTNRQTYLLPIKAEIRRKINVEIGQEVTCILGI